MSIHNLHLLARRSFLRAGAVTVGLPLPDAMLPCGLRAAEKAAALLVTGTNVAAIEVHQNALTSSDLSMDFELSATTLVPTAMTLAVARASNALIPSWPAAGAFGVQYATNLTPPVAWLSLTNSPVFTNNEWCVTLPVASNGQRFFRLQTP